jgi:hypothetical protein
MKKDYIGGPFILSWFNKDGDIFRQITAPVVFPGAAIPLENDFDWAENGIVSIDGWSMHLDYFDETWI